MRSARPLLAVALAAALAPGAASQDAPPPHVAALDRVERHVVEVAFRFQRDLGAEAEGAVGADPDAATESYRRWRMSARVPGFVVRDRRTVLVSDPFVTPGALRSITVTGRDGRPVAARLEGFLPRCGAVLVGTEEDLGTEPVPFPPQVEVATASPLLVGSLAEGARGLEAWADVLGVARRPAFSGAGLSWGMPERIPAGLSGSDRTRTIDLVVAPDGSPLGVRLGATLDLEGSVWRGHDVLADLAQAIPFASLRERALGLNASSFVHAVRLAFRSAEADPDAAQAAFAAAYGRGTPVPEPDDEARWWGLAIAPDLLLVPAALPETWIRRIGRVAVEEPGGPTYEATFEGRLRGLGAFVVRVPGATLDALPAARPPFPPADHAFLVHHVAWRAGARRDVLEPNRSLGRARGFGDLAYFASERRVPPGAFLLDLGGHVWGFAVDLLPDEPDRDPGRRPADPDARGRGVIAATFAELGAPQDLARDLDRRVLPTGAKDLRRRMWLGVEYEPIRGAAVAEALEVSEPTRDGTRGLLVNVVYDGSPAARAGLRPDDVLLSARRHDARTAAESPPVDLRDAAGAVEWTDDADFPRPWAPRMNALVRLLEAWGEGTPYRLEVLREGRTSMVDVAVEAAPPDVSSVPEVRDAPTGLGVKPLTYEVRHALRLPPDAPGVLVSSVEEGSPADQARIVRHEVLFEVDGAPVTGPDDVVARLAKARAAGRTDLRASVRRWDRSRFVDLRVRAPGPPPPAGR